MTTETPSPNLLLADHYDFDLPKELIAQNPLPNREDARLMHINRHQKTIEHQHIRDFDQLLNEGDCLVLNNTRVILSLIHISEPTRLRRSRMPSSA